MKKIKISVIMPAYNTPKDFFLPAIDSILNQTYKNIELIVIDDGSDTKDIYNIISKIKDKRLKYINQGHHGAGEARNIGIKVAKGDFLYIMASDDSLDLNAFAVCVDLIKNYDNPDIVLFNLVGQEDNGNIHVYNKPVPFSITNPGDTTQLVKKSLVIDNDIKYYNFTSCNDLTFTYTVLACAKKVVKINKAFYYYNTNVPNQISSNRGAKAKNVFYAFDALERNLRSKKLFITYKEYFYDVFKDCVLYELSNITDLNHKQSFLEYLKTKHNKVYRKVFSYKYKIIGKQRNNNIRVIYFCGIKLFSYSKNFFVNPCLFDIDIIKHHAFLIHKNNLSNLVLGSSTARDGYIPDNETFNFGMSSQDLYHAYNLYKWCQNQNVNINNIVLFFDVFTSGLQIEKTSEGYKSLIYKILYNIPFACKLDMKYKKFERKLKRYIKTLKLPDDLLSGYYGKSFYNNKEDAGDIKELVIKHLKNACRNNNQIIYLYKLYNEIKNNNQKLYIIIPPYRSDYKDCLPEKETIFKELYDFLNKNSDVKFFDFIYDQRFTKQDFSDCHHLNENGASKLTKYIEYNIKHSAD